GPDGWARLSREISQPRMPRHAAGVHVQAAPGDPKVSLLPPPFGSRELLALHGAPPPPDTKPVPPWPPRLHWGQEHPRPPMRYLRLGSILQSSALPTPQAVDPMEDAGGPPAARAREPLAVPAKHRRCVGVGHEKASELNLRRRT